jgi:serine kinase of HPr protein (carbohydrate metabolism regulator)
MICKIADLITQIPEEDASYPWYGEYLWEGEEAAQIAIRRDLYRSDKYSADMSAENVAYMEAARQFYVALLYWEGLYLHASALELDGKAFLFSGDSGAGKSTHTRLWQQVFGGAAQVINDDKPALRCLDGVWYAYGTPWCGKDHINRNRKVPVAGICFLKQSDHNAIRRLEPCEVIQRIMSQTIFRFSNVERLDLMLGHLDNLVQKIPVYELENRPEPEAARLSCETMRRGAEENGL